MAERLVEETAHMLRSHEKKPPVQQHGAESPAEEASSTDSKSDPAWHVGGRGKNRLVGMCSAKGSLVLDTFRDDLPIFLL